MPCRRMPEHSANLAIIRTIAVEQGMEARVMAGFQKVDEFMRDDEFQAGRWICRKSGGDADGSRLGRAGAPTRFHGTHGPARRMDPHRRLQPLDNRWKRPKNLGLVQLCKSLIKFFGGKRADVRLIKSEGAGSAGG